MLNINIARNITTESLGADIPAEQAQAFAEFAQTRVAELLSSPPRVTVSVTVADHLPHCTMDVQQMGVVEAFEQAHAEFFAK
jgi:hypothetical protein